MDPVKYSKALRAVRERPLKFSHESFLDAIRREPEEQTHRAVYADWLEENAPDSVHPDTLHQLRTQEGPMWVSHRPNGQVTAGDVVMPEQRMREVLSQTYPLSYPAGRTRLIHTVHGPAGSFGVIESHPTIHQMMNEGPDYHVAQFFPGWTDNIGFHDKPEQAIEAANTHSQQEPIQLR